MKLEEGMYVRTEHGEFTKIESFYIRHEEAQEYVISFSNGSRWRGYLEDLKASYNIIDLIEVGDYVNGFRVDEVDKAKFTIYIGNTKEVIEQALWSNDIKSIVTKEQFSQMEYRLGD